MSNKEKSTVTLRDFAVMNHVDYRDVLAYSRLNDFPEPAIQAGGLNLYTWQSLLAYCEEKGIIIIGEDDGHNR